jgi:hypothetical protein
MIDDRTRSAIEAADTDELLRIVDGHCDARAWDSLALLRDHCQAAVERGKQVWSIDEHIRYRLALEAPGEIAAGVIAEGPTRFTLGPLPEVAASTHDWGDLEPHLPPGPERSITAHECIVRGADLEGSDVDPLILELPLRRYPWEPHYPAARYEAHRAEFPEPDLPRMSPIEVRHGAPRHPADDATDALMALVMPWVEESTGRADVVEVSGDLADALGTLGVPRAGAAPIGADAALAWMAWAAASGGTHGRRRGMAAGRFGAWWAAATLTGLDWPPDPDELGRRLDSLDWHVWTDGTSTGWNLRIAAGLDGVTRVVAAVDAPAT